MVIIGKWKFFMVRIMAEKQGNIELIAEPLEIGFISTLNLLFLKT